MNIFARYRGYLVLTLIFAIIFGGYVWFDRRPQPEPFEIVTPEASTPTLAATATFEPTPTSAPIRVHVVGAVVKPGVYQLPPDSRVVQAVEAAGGLLEEADEAAVNLADHVWDGQQIRVPSCSTPLPPPPTASSPPISQRADVAPQDASAKVNINTATLAELDSLPGIGEAYAGRIIAYRETHGPFTELSQITNVSGIGPVCYERIKDLITIR